MYRNSYSTQRGFVLIAAIVLSITVLLLMVIFAVIASRAAIASSRQKADLALTSARSGAEIMLYVLQQMYSSQDGSPQGSYHDLRTSLQNGLGDLEINGVTVTSQDGVISISSVILNSSTGQSFTAHITADDADTLTADVTGMAGDVLRTLRLKYNLQTGAHLIYDPARSSSESPEHT